MRPQPAHPGEVVLELGELDLELSLRRVSVVGEDVEDYGRPVDHRYAEVLLEVPLLPRGELVVAGDQVGVRCRDLLQFGELAAPQISVGIGLEAPLDEIAGRRHPGGTEQLLQLAERILAALTSRTTPIARALTAPVD